jgi:hypothetical protein
VTSSPARLPRRETHNPTVNWAAANGHKDVAELLANKAEVSGNLALAPGYRCSHRSMHRLEVSR